VFWGTQQTKRRRKQTPNADAIKRHLEICCLQAVEQLCGHAGPTPAGARSHPFTQESTTISQPSASLFLLSRWI